VPTAHDGVLLSPVEGARPVDAVVRFVVRTAELLLATILWPLPRNSWPPSN